jgi:hypothetical protein
MTLTFADAEDLMRRARNGSRRLRHNTYLYPSGPDAYAVRFHSTDVVTIHRDGTWTLRTGGWETVTTKARINDYSPARVYSEDRALAVWDRDSDPRTPPKICTCRVCHGAGRVRQQGYRSYHKWTADGDYKRIFPPVITMPRWAKCYRCGGSGQRDYGSKTMPVLFFDGITGDSHGSVVNATGLERLREPAEVQAARLEAAQRAVRLARRNERRDFIREHGLVTEPGTVTMFKAVRDDLRSAHGALYEIGTTVTAADYAPNRACGNGLHFSPAPIMALDYDSSATRFLACAVDRKTMVILDDKAKARSCRVLYETDENGNQLQPEIG